MADTTRKITAKFDGDTTGLAAASKRGERIVGDFGEKSGKTFGSRMKQWLTGDGGGLFSEIGKSGGTVFGSGFLGALKTPILGPAISGVLGAAVLSVMPAIGATAAGGMVFAFGAGLAGLGLAVTKNSPRVVAAIDELKRHVTTKMQEMAKPFEQTWIEITSGARDTFDAFAPELDKAFARLAPITSRLSGDFFDALEQLVPVIDPVVDGFEAIAESLGPALPGIVGGIGDGITKISESVEENPTALTDFFSGMGLVTEDALELIAALNDMNGEIEDLTGGVSAVDIVIGVLRGPIVLTTGAVKGLTTFVNGLNRAWKAISGIFSKTHTAKISGNGGGFFSVIRSVQSTALSWGRSIYKATIGANGGGVGTVVSWAYRVGGEWASKIFKATFSAVGDQVRAVFDYVNGLGNSWAGKVFKASFGAVSLVPGLFGRAAGGPVSEGQSYLVGERGPEIITMGGNGFVTPNDRLGGLGGTPEVRVFIGDTELKGMIRTEVVDRDRRTKRAVSTGALRGAVAY